MRSNVREEAIAIFRETGGYLRASEATLHGIHWRVLQQLCNEKVVEHVCRGLYRLVDMPLSAQTDYALLAKKVPQGVVCLVSALAFHELTTQIPHFLYVAIHRKSKPPNIQYPPIRFFWYSQRLYSEGIEEHVMDGQKVRIFDKEKTLVDCIKYRNKIGMDVVLEALHEYWKSGKVDLDKLMHYAREFRVAKILRPILETLMHE